MVTFHIAKLKLRGPIHISRGRIDPESSAEIIHSDTMKSALFAIGLQLFGYKELEAIDYWNAFHMSSGFPFLKEECFFPKPMTKLNMTIGQEKEGATLTKKLKKLTYLGTSYFEQTLSGHHMEVPLKDFFDGGEFVSAHPSVKKLYKEAPKSRIIGKDLQQRVRINTQDTFYVERVYFHPEAGLYFLFTGLTEELKERLSAMIKLLGESGLGKNRTFGFGQFTFEEFEEVQLEVPDKADKWTNVGLYCPAGERKENAEIDAHILEQSAYSLIKRGGWISSPENNDHLKHRKRSVYMFKEGSVFHFGPSDEGVQIKGKMVDLTPDIVKEHEIWREGRSLFLPIIDV